LKQQPKILLAAPTSTYKDYIFLEWYLHASTLTYSNYDLLIVNNSRDKTYHEKLKKMGINTLWVNPEGKSCKDYVCESQNMLRDYFLEHDYDYYFSLEVDIFPPRNVIEKLLCAKKQLISAPYFYDFGKKSKPLLYCFSQDKNKIYHNYQVDLLQSLEVCNGDVVQVYAAGIGCMLIERAVMEKIKFRIDPKIDAFSDTPFYIDLYNNKIFNYIDTSMICKHYNSDWFQNIDAA
jgi:hypothetical protein